MESELLRYVENLGLHFKVLEDSIQIYFQGANLAAEMEVLRTRANNPLGLNGAKDAMPI